MKQDIPVFEVLNGSQHIKIYRNGKVGGVCRDAIIINRFFTFNQDKSSQQDCSPKRSESISLSAGGVQGEGL